MAIKAVFFDLWGTLVESGVHPSIIQQTKSIMHQQRMSFSEFVLKFEGVIMTRPFEDKRKAFQEACKVFHVRYDDRMIDALIGVWNSNVLLSHLYDDTIEELERLRGDGYKLVLISNMPSFSGQVLDKFDLHKYFDKVLLSYEQGMLKTQPQMFEHALHEMGLHKDEAIMVGDSIPTDIVGAQRAGLKAVLIDRRNRRDFQPKILTLKELETHLQ